MQGDVQRVVAQDDRYDFGRVPSAISLKSTCCDRKFLRDETAVVAHAAVRLWFFMANRRLRAQKNRRNRSVLRRSTSPVYALTSLLDGEDALYIVSRLDMPS
jgi:hypothetical protein